ncbi:MAG: aminomethyl-transferring glycine dehydrogenase subunit GcvPB [Armatimonadetes bacterium]|nr:aminomethyl-transferring glycine dehydrogenase subunit GcvPB [Armatimonadota bacterium]
MKGQAVRSVPLPKLIFEKSRKGRVGCNVPVADTPEVDLKAALGQVREELHLPEVSELEVLRHFTILSHVNYGIETGFYPLGSCTMKYNPKINERTAALPGFSMLHPMQPASMIPGAMEILLGVQDMLKEITGFDYITLQPVAGAHGEMTCLMLIRAYHESRGEGKQRHTILVPDSAHGTNPASAARCGYDVKSIPTDADGNTDLKALEAALDDSIAGLMLTNPSTLGLFEPNITKICEMVHKAGGMVFCDGANMNAMVGTTRPGDHGFDCMHLNLHKTFSTPHGGGGPGCGAIGIKSHLEPFLPVPIVQRVDGKPSLDWHRPHSIGRVSPYYGQFLMEVRAYTYLRAYGKEKMHEISHYAVLNANYIKARLKDVLPAAYDRPCMHECVLTAEKYKKQHGVRALDISKRLIDYGFHPPTNYFPLIVPEAMMIEPTETECKETLDAFCDAMIEICTEAVNDPDLLHNAPTSQIVGRLDETKAVKELDVRWRTKREGVKV